MTEIAETKIVLARSPSVSYIEISMLAVSGIEGGEKSAGFNV